MQLLPPWVQQFSRYPLRNSEDFAIPVMRTAIYSNSFLPTALRDWNGLSPDTQKGSAVVECLTPDRGAAGLSLTGVTALCP